MKKIISISLSFLLIFLLLGGEIQAKTPVQKIVLNGEKIGATLSTDGSHFWKGNGSGYEFPINSGKFTMSGLALWIGGYDKLGKLHVSGQTYSESGTDFTPGPLNNLGKSDSNSSNNYNKFFEVKKLEIDSFILGISVPKSILNWPGNGNASLNEPKKLAPFIDKNGNGIYEPTKGDYPDIKGDDAIWFVYNDDTIHTSSGSIGLGVEVQVLAYTFHCKDNDVLSKSTFFDYKITNRSGIEYNKCRIGLWADFDLGNPKNDYVGCDSTKGLVYAYNAEKFDKDTFGIINIGDTVRFKGYGLQTPIQSMCFYNGITLGNGTKSKLSNFIYLFNDQATGIQTKPRFDKHYYDYLSSKWLNDAPLTVGGTGYTKNSTKRTQFAFNGNPLNSKEWTEISAKNPFADRSTVSGFGPFTLSGNDSVSFSVAFSTHQVGSGKFENNYQQMIDENTKLNQVLVQGNFVGCDGVSTCNSSPSCVWPGDANNDGIVNYKDLFYTGFAINSKGSPRTIVSTGYVGNSASNFGKTFPNGLDFKHADADGNGIIDSQDVLSIDYHYKKRHNKKETTLLTNGNARIYAILVEDSLFPGKVYTIYINYDPGTDTGLVKIAGYSFDIKTVGYPIDSENIQFVTNSNFTPKGEYIRLIKYDPITKTHTVVVMRNGGDIKTAKGTIGTVKYVISDNISGGYRPEIFINIINGAAIDGKLNEVSILTEGDSGYVKKGVGIENFNSENRLNPKIYPNPANNILKVNTNTFQVLDYEILDLCGKSIARGKVKGEESISLEGINVGIYMIQFSNKSAKTSYPLYIIR